MFVEGGWGLPYFRLFCADSTVKLGARCLAVDRVFINSGYDRLGLEPGTTVEGLPNGGKYHTAQYFIIPRGAPASDRLTVLDCAILASVISDRARDYSSLSYMCCWYATMFFLCAHRICSDRKIAPPIQDKKLKSTGKWGKFTLIDYHTGRLKLPNGASFEDTKQSFERSMTRRQVPPAQIASILATLGADKSHAETETEAWIMGPDPISVVIELFNARRCQLMLSMKADIARAVAVRTRAAREIAEAKAEAVEAKAEAVEAKAEAEEKVARANEEAAQAKREAEELRALLAQLRVERGDPAPV
ncbi:hypothetical protein R3P38DRAFT_3267080 [Favolaschia claudopus]|uniref:Uncharacterized protein n=1 Tax=Favolaschia claudopus TaxID=2862362 RepID=A0AAV9ZWY1_9AGAR